MSSESAEPPFKFFGGRVGLDFANSLNWRLTGTPVDLVPDYAGLLLWSECRGTLPERAIALLRRHASLDEPRSRAVMAGAHRLRAELIKVLAALEGGHHPDLAAINHGLAALPSQPNLVEDGGRLVFDLDGSELEQLLWPILWSTTAVLASSDGRRIGSCRARGCGWFFIDESPSRSRLWCSDGCGNRERVWRASMKRKGGAS